MLVSGALLCGAVLWSSLDTAVAAVRRVRVQQLVDENVPGARSLQRLMENSIGFVATSRMVVTGSLVGITALAVAAAGGALA
ncbi:MAG TPA: CNNM domain-containing protein, partial [Chloroflexota bacterium]|nr:CNNM domain-containing protein [Chloroflexota bacterium]